MNKLLILMYVLLAPTIGASAQQAEDNTFGGWLFCNVNHDFDNGIYVSGYFEHENYHFQRLDSNYFRVSAGYGILPWLKMGVNYVPVYEPGNSWLHYGEVDLVGTLKSGNLKVSIRERYRYGFTNGKNELRSRLKVAYSFPDSKFGIYLAPEVFTWGNEWKKTRHYAGGTFGITDKIQLEAYYMYYAFKDSPAENVIGFGVNFDL